MVAVGQVVTGGGGAVSWNDVSGKPATFPPSAHTHPTSEVTGLDTALAGKAPLTHTHAIADVTGLQAALDARTPSLVLNATDPVPDGTAPGTIIVRTA